MYDGIKILILVICLFEVCALPYCFATLFFHPTFLHERCHWRAHDIGRRIMQVPRDCVILINEELFEKMSERKKKKIVRFVNKLKKAGNLRIGLRPESASKSMGTCYTPIIVYSRNRANVLEAACSLAAPYYGCSWQLLLLSYIGYLILSLFVPLPLNPIQLTFLCLVFYILTPVVLVLADAAQTDGSKVKQDAENFFKMLEHCSTKEEISKCFEAFPTASDGYKLRHIKWYVATVARYASSVKEQCERCGIPYFDRYDEIVEMLDTGTYREL